MAPVLRRAVLAVTERDGLRDLIVRAPVSGGVVRRFVAGETGDDAVRAAAGLAAAGIEVTIDHLGEHTTDRRLARQTTNAYLDLIGRLAAAGLTADGRAEVSVKLSAVGQALGPDGPAIATAHAHEICVAAAAAGTTVTVDMEDHTSTDDTLDTVRQLRADHPWVGAVLQAYLRRTEADCADLAGAGSRVRLCKGAYAEPESVAYPRRAEIDRSYVRCLKVLMAGSGRPLVATHDPRLIEIAVALAERNRRPAGSLEFQLLYGVRPEEQARLAALGETVRVYVPYGANWYGYLTRRLAEKPANTLLFLRALTSRR